MFRHYFLTAVRNLLRYKLFTTINVTGLSLSIAIFLALTGYVGYHLSFDKFYKDGDRIFRIDYYEYQGGQAVLQSARTHDRTALIAGEYVPQIEAITRVYNEKAYIFTEDIRIVDQDMLYVDSSFFKVFDINVISGSKETSLIPPHSVMVSRSQAEAYFGKSDPIGKVLYFNERLPFTVTGVFEDIPRNTSINYDFLLSWSTMPFHGWIPKDGDFESPYTFTFVKLRDHVTDISAINTTLTNMANEHIMSLKLRGHTARHELRAYTDLHVSPGLSGEIKPGTSKILLYSLISLAIFILIAAWINYINLSLARSLERADEIGVRKVFGASRLAISAQFLLEALILSVVTFVVGYGIFWFFSGPFVTILFKDIAFLPMTTIRILAYFIGFVVGTSLMAFYPAHFISQYKPVAILKNKLGNGRGKAAILYQGLMVFQLFLAITIVGITLVASRQIDFMRHVDSGFNASQTIALRAPASTNSDSLRGTRYSSFRNDVLQLAGFKAGTSSFNIPGQEVRFHDEGVHAIGSSNEKKQSFQVMWIDEGYQETFGLHLLAGRNFREKESGQTCMINESAVRALGYASPLDAINSVIQTASEKAITIIGVWKDYHHESMHRAVDPMLFLHRHPFEYGYYSFRVESAKGQYLSSLENVWKKHYPNDQFVYYFMNNFFEEQYKSDELFARLLNLFSIISISVASLGLLGMATLAMVKRTKEIAVRKTLGASVVNILFMLSRNYIRLVIISSMLAFPAAYYLVYIWLQGFAYKIDIQWWMIVLPGAIVMSLVLVTISSQALRAAFANPASSLRDQ